MTRKRTKKEFVNYNDYVDRPFGLKWGTAFALSELTKVIDQGKHEAVKQNTKLPEMTRYEMDAVLQQAFLKKKQVSVQLNLYDDNQNIIDAIEGSFEGFADDESLYIQDYAIAWDSIRNIRILEGKK